LLWAEICIFLDRVNEWSMAAVVIRKHLADIGAKYRKEAGRKWVALITIQALHLCKSAVAVLWRRA